jgi:aspartyl/asparaginyl-tRNA synthetase
MRSRMLVSGIRPEQYDFYLGRIKDAPLHGGFGLSLDRLLARALGYRSVREIAPLLLG